MTSQTTFTSCMHDQMLESNRDDVKLEAMRCVTVMTAKGKLSVPRTLFPHIVKNISSKNPELKKLIYLYLTNFSDQEPDLALLPVATLQKSLKSPNPLVRSSALKVLTSMRLSILSAILMATLRNSVNDLSPYVRKTVAHAIIKIYRLEPELRSDLIEYVERLFNDKNSMVLSSAVATFEVVCPEKLELVHKHYRRFCFILADCNEWGQIVLLKLLMRYVIDSHKRGKEGKLENYNPAEHDPKTLLRSAKPLMHSNNSAVVMAVIKLYIAIANHNEVRSTITRPLIRLLYSHREIQLTVLKMIEELTNLDKEVETDGMDAESDEEIEKDGSDEKKNDKVDENNEEENADDNDADTKVDYEIDQKVDQMTDENLVEEEEEEEDCEDESQSSDEEGESVSSGDEEQSETSDEEEESETSDEEEATMANGDKDKNIITNVKGFDPNAIDLEANKDPSAFREVFRSYIKSFFIKHTDCTQIRLAKLQILTNLSSPVNVNQILRELQAYISTYADDKEFVSAAIHAMGRCAIVVKEVAHTCLNGLTNLLSNNNEHIVSEAIVVLRSQIINKKPRNDVISSESTDVDANPETAVQSNDKTEGIGATDKTTREPNQPETFDSIGLEDNKIVSTVIKQVTKLLPTVTAPQARATILWILAEFCDKNRTVAKCAPNVLRSMAKTFCQEDNFVKLQCLTLATKYMLSLDKEKKAELYQKVQLLANYIFSLAKYDINHDVRDRSRFLKKLLEDEHICAQVLKANSSIVKQQQQSLIA